MGIMQKEIRSHKMSIAIIKSVVFMSFMIALGGLVGKFRFNNFEFATISNPVLIVVTVVAIYFMINNCRTSYKYSVVGDRLLIHKVDSKKQVVLENVRVSDILYIGKDKKEISKLSAKNSRSYTCDLFNSNKSSCVFKSNGSVRKFNFQASDEFISKVNSLKVSIDRHS